MKGLNFNATDKEIVFKKYVKKLLQATEISAPSPGKNDKKDNDERREERKKKHEKRTQCKEISLQFLLQILSI